ncbi:MAG TPA: ABC transporter permease subunit [Elusimicrobiales bacterium]|nr:ABC transporter permease subunit [Elusimicrobiales bacterium]
MNKEEIKNIAPKMESLKLWLDKFVILYAKETAHYFYTPSAYVVTVVFLLISGYFFATPIFLQNQANISTFLSIAPLLFIFFIPAITMRLIAEEYKSKTIEILLTNPVTVPQVITAKLASAMTLIAVTLALTLIYPLSISLLGNLDMGAVWCGYLGLALTCLLYGSIGMFASSITKNQITAFIIGFMLCFILFVTGKITSFVPGWLVNITNFLGTDSHLDNLSRGIIDSRDIIYYLTVSGFFMFLTYVKLITSRTD